MALFWPFGSGTGKGKVNWKPVVLRYYSPLARVMRAAAAYRARWRETVESSTGSECVYGSSAVSNRGSRRGEALTEINLREKGLSACLLSRRTKTKVSSARGWRARNEEAGERSRARIVMGVWQAVLSGDGQRR